MGENCKTDECGGSCGCASESQSCGCASSGCGCASDCSCDFYEAMQERLMQMALFAHKSALFERIKSRIEKTEGERLDKVAGLVVEASLGKFKDAQDSEKKKEELRQRLRELLGN